KSYFPEVWQQNQLRDKHEPLRLKLTFIKARLDATRREVAARDAGRPEIVPGSYKRAQEFIEDLELCQRVVELANAKLSQRFLLTPLLGQVKTLGFTGYRLDLREDSEAHTRALEEIAARTGTTAP